MKNFGSQNIFKKILIKICLSILWKLSDDAISKVSNLGAEYENVPLPLMYVTSWKETFWFYKSEDFKETKKWLNEKGN